MKLACLSVYAQTDLTVAKTFQKRSECRPINFDQKNYFLKGLSEKDSL